MIINASKDEFQKNGCSLYKNLIPVSVINEVINGMNEIVARQLQRLSLAKYEKCYKIECLYKNLKLLFNADKEVYLACLKLAVKQMSVYELTMQQNIKEMTSRLGIEHPVFQTLPVLHIMSHHLKIPNGYSGVGVHQDWPALQSGLDTLIIWIPLFDVNEKNFPLEIIPGSHLLGFCEAVQREHIHEVNPSCYDNDKFESVVASPGDVFLMSTFLLHRSGQTGEDGLRLAVSMRYENAAEPTFIDRCYPYTQKRVVERTLILKDFPSKAQVEKIYSNE